VNRATSEAIARIEADASFYPAIASDMTTLATAARLAAETIAAQQAHIRELESSNAKLHRRAQEAESIIAQAGLVEARSQGPSRSFGRALANYAAGVFQREGLEWKARAETAEAKLSQAKAALNKIADNCVDWTATHLETFAEGALKGLED